MKAALTALFISTVLIAARRFGGRLAGVLAGLPLSTVSALVWVAETEGAAPAARLAIGSVTGCGVVAVFALVYERSAQLTGPKRALGVALAALVVIALPVHAIDLSWWSTLLAAAAVCLVALAVMPIADAGQMRAAGSRHRIVWYAVMAGSVGAAVSAIGLAVDPLLAGFLASLPVVCAASVTAEHAVGGGPSVTCFLRGYVITLLARSVFGSTFAALTLAVSLGSALVGALAVGAACGVVGHRCLR